MLTRCPRGLFPLLSLLTPFLLLLNLSWALHQSDVGVVDWHKQLVGVPVVLGSAGPVFLRVPGSPSNEDTDSIAHEKTLIVTVTANNVLAALESGNGSVAWRYIFEAEDGIATFRVDTRQQIVTTLSGPGGSVFRSFNATNGALLVEQYLHEPDAGILAEPHSAGKDISYALESDDSISYDALVLTNGHQVRRINVRTGEVRWTWTSPDQTSLTLYSTIVSAKSAVYAIGVSKSLEAYTLHITSLAPSAGHALMDKPIPSRINDPLADVHVLVQHGGGNVASTEPHTRVVWLEQGFIRSVALTDKLSAAPSSVRGTTYSQLVNPRSFGAALVAVKDDGVSRVMKLDVQGDLKSVWEFEGSAPSDANSPSIFSSGKDKNGDLYITRLYWSHALNKAAVDTYWPHLLQGKGLVKGLAFPFDSASNGRIIHVSADSQVLDESGQSSVFVTTSTGAVQLWSKDELVWSREESLSTIAVSQFVELPEEILIGDGAKLGHESFLQRLKRQVVEAQDLPQYIIHFVTRFATGSYASLTSAAVTKSRDGLPSRDTFGFRQIVVVATLYGNVFGIDSSNGEILWKRVFGLGWAAETGGVVKPVKMFVLKTVADAEGATPEVAIVGQRKAENSLVDTVLFHVNALTGADARTGSSEVPTGPLEGTDIVPGPLVDAYMLDASSTKIVIILDEFLQTYLYPSTSQSQEAFALLSPSLSIPLRTTASGQNRIAGHKFTLHKSMSDKPVAYPTWTLSLPPDEDVQQMIPALKGPIASVGKVLGNRTTLYKYLNPRLFTVLSASKPGVTPPSCGVYIVDSTKGSVIYHANLPAADVHGVGRGGQCDVKAVLAENWLVYHYYENELGGGGAKGYRVVSVEFYEGSGIDEKTESSDLTSFSEESLNLMAIEQAYEFPHAITAMSATSTKYGITQKDLIVATKNHKIQAFSRRLLNPRRPNRKVTAEEQEEFLVPYDPVLADDPRQVISHNYQVAQTRQITTSPALLESTTLVFTFGLDLFLTRIAPSGTFDVLSESFNKVQLILTVSGLAFAIMVTKPMVRRKKLRERWYNS